MSMNSMFDDLLGDGPDAGENNLQLALKLAAKGIPVFPCREVAETVAGKLRKEKSPATKNGFKDASTDASQIRLWWKRRPYALVGMPTGAASGFAVIDLDRHDPKADGVAALAGLGLSPETLTNLRATTAGNGLHLYFKHADGITNKDNHLPKGIDVRAEGGYVIAPGTMFADGRSYGSLELTKKAPAFPEALLPPPEADYGSGETGDKFRLDLTIDEIREYMADYPNDEDTSRQDWIAVIASLNHEATAANEDGDIRPKSERDAICQIALDWTAKNPDYNTPDHLKQAKADFKSFRPGSHKNLSTFRSIAKVVRSIRQEQEIEEAIDDFDEVDDLASDDDPDLDGFEDILGGSSDDAPAKPKKAKKREAWDDPIAPKHIRLMNKNHAIVRFKAKTYVVDIAPKGSDEIISLGDEKSLHLAYANKEVEMVVPDPDTGKLKTKKFTWSQLWLKSEYRRYYPKGICFNPQKDEDGKLNLWRGFSMEPDASGKCDLLLDHIEQVLCRGVKEHADAFMDFIAHIVQKPWERPTFALVMRGEMGAGKDTPFRYLGELLSAHYITVGRNSDISGRFNEHLMGKILVHLQEGFFAGDRQQQNYMKFLLDSPKINIESKGVNIFSTVARHRTVISSNEDWVAPAARGERRYFVLDVDDRFANGSSDASVARNKRYFNAIDDQMRNKGGLAKFLHVLMTRDISNFDTRRPPRTQALVQQIKEGFRGVERWWYDVLEVGSIDNPTGNTDTALRALWERDWITKPTDELFDSYEAWRKGERFRADPVTRAKFAREMRRLCPRLLNKQLVLQSKGERTRTTIIPSLGQCRDDLDELLGGAGDWDQITAAPPEEDDL